MQDLVEMITRVLSAPFQYLFEPSQRLYWPALLAALAVALLMMALTARRKKDETDPRVAWRRLWHWSTGPSSRLDVKLLWLNAFLKTIIAIPVLLPAAAIAAWFLVVAKLVFGPGAFFSGLSAPWVALIYSVALFIVGDLSRFLLHWCLHHVGWMWRVHQVHHSALVLTPVTIYRSHPLESLLYSVRSALSIGLTTGVCSYLCGPGLTGVEILGVNAFGFFFNFLGANLRHTHVWLSYGRCLEHVFISPAQHQIHHSDALEHRNKNLGSCFALWDWLAGSLVIAGWQCQKLRFGLGYKVANSLWESVMVPFKSTAAMSREHVPPHK